jgi:hypothetical protein
MRYLIALSCLIGFLAMCVFGLVHILCQLARERSTGRFALGSQMPLRGSQRSIECVKKLEAQDSPSARNSLGSILKPQSD